MARFRVLVKGTLRIRGRDILDLQRKINSLDGEELERLVQDGLLRIERISLQDYVREDQ